MNVRIGGAAALVVLAATVLASCNSKPSQDQAKAVFTSYLTTAVKGAPFNIDSFQKTNGQDSEIEGTKVYIFYYSATISFPEGYRSECISTNGQFTGLDCMLQTGVMGPPPIPKGARLNYTGTIRYQNSEKGWLPDLQAPQIANAGASDVAAANNIDTAPASPNTPPPPPVAVTPTKPTASFEMVVVPAHWDNSPTRTQEQWNEAIGDANRKLIAANIEPVSVFIKGQTGVEIVFSSATSPELAKSIIDSQTSLPFRVIEEGTCGQAVSGC